MAYPSKGAGANAICTGAVKEFDRILVVDWSARSAPSPRRPSADAIWIGEADADGVTARYLRSRAAAMADLDTCFAKALAAGERLLCGFDFPFGYPAGFAARVAGEASGLAVWRMLAKRIEDDERNGNNRFAVAAGLNALFPGTGPFWGCPQNQTHSGLPHRGRARQDHGLPERRLVETRIRSAQPCWKLFTTGSVGGQALLGLARLQDLRERWGTALSVWPFEARESPVVLAEIYPSILAAEVKAAQARWPGAIKDDIQVRLSAVAFYELQRRGRLRQAIDAAEGPDLAEEAWILGIGAEQELGEAAEAVGATIYS